MNFCNRCCLSLIFLLILFSCSSPNKAIKNINAYYTVTTPGNIPVDRAGNSLYKGPDTSNIVYVEIHGKGPEWQYAWQHNRCYKLVPVLVRENQLMVGKEKTSEEKITVVTAGTSKLYQLVFEPSSEKIPAPETTEQSEILLQGKYKGKMFLRKVSSAIELYQQPTE